MLSALWKRTAYPPDWIIFFRFFELPPWKGFRLTRKRYLNLLRARWEWWRGRTLLSAYPTRLTIEPINTCNLRCPACMTGMGEVGRRRSAMSLSLYRRLLAELGEHLFELEFTNWGEPLHCRELPTMVKEAAALGIATTVVTHLSVPLADDQIRALMRSGLKVLGVSIDGAFQESYETYRRNGNLALVLENCRRLIAAKRELASRTRVIWSYHVFPHNAGEVEEAARMAAAIGMEFAATKGAVLAQEWDDGGRWRFFGDPRPVRCPYLWSFAVVNNDGGVPPCQGAFYADDDMGRIADPAADMDGATFMEVWNNGKFQAARALFRERVATDETRRLLCLECPVAIGHERLRRHVDNGGRVHGFDIGYSTNDVWKYFLDRRGALSRTTRPAPSRLTA